MKISNPGASPLARLSNTPSPAAAAGPRNGSAERPASDQIQLSNLSAYLAVAQSDTPAHAEKMSSLSGAVSNGTYHVDASLVSASIVQHSLAWGGANSLGI